MSGFVFVVRALSVLALVTGAVDVLVGLSGQELIGAALVEGYRDPLLNSQLRYLGAIWFGFGALLWRSVRHIGRNEDVLRGAFVIVFLGGLGRIASVLQFGFPPSTGGTVFVIVAIAIEILGMPLLLLWLRRLTDAGR